MSYNLRKRSEITESSCTGCGLDRCGSPLGLTSDTDSKRVEPESPALVIDSYLSPVSHNKPDECLTDFSKSHGASQLESRIDRLECTVEKLAGLVERSLTVADTKNEFSRQNAVGYNQVERPHSSQPPIYDQAGVGNKTFDTLHQRKTLHEGVPLATRKKVLAGNGTSHDHWWLQACKLVGSAYSANTDRTYGSGQKIYLQFCDTVDALPIPASENVLLMFIAYLQEERKLKYSSIVTYLYSVRALQIQEGLPDPLQDRPRIHLALRSVNRSQGPESTQKLAITFDLLQRLQPLFDISCTKDLVVWTAMTTAFFGLFRSGELVIKDLPFIPATDLTVSDITFSKQSGANVIAIVHLKKSKCDPFRKGVDVIIGCSHNTICAVDLLSRLHSLRIQAGASPNDPFFLLPGNVPLTRQFFIRHLKHSIGQIGLDPNAYSGHSFRSGGATSAAAAGVSDWEIKVMGRWSSDCYKRYIRTPRQVLSTFAKRMIFT
ncbi:integrase/recombinase xerD homolog [Ptychodera flava]|uniref:integrase/recombinase xerD homolog n=1 Tax=Ptychodera flava TaxID=63121 RepID=UPI00396A838D